MRLKRHVKEITWLPSSVVYREATKPICKHLTDSLWCDVTYRVNYFRNSLLDQMGAAIHSTIGAQNET